MRESCLFEPKHASERKTRRRQGEVGTQDAVGVEVEAKAEAAIGAISFQTRLEEYATEQQPPSQKRKRPGEVGTQDAVGVEVEAQGEAAIGAISFQTRLEKYATEKQPPSQMRRRLWGKQTVG